MKVYHSLRRLLSIAWWWFFRRHTPIVVITDCRDPNARARQETRLAAYFPGANITFIGVKNDAEAAINVVDQLDALDGKRGILLVNVAPRGGKAKKKWKNGTPFGELSVGKATIYTTIDGQVLTLLQQLLGYQLEVQQFDIPTAVPYLGLSEEKQQYVISTQFRSYEFLPRVAKARQIGVSIPTTPFSEVPDFEEPVVCWIDCFGNVKTGIVADEHTLPIGSSVSIRIDGYTTHAKVYARLKDIPNGELGLVAGSSGLGSKRLLEIMLQGRSAWRERLQRAQSGSIVVLRYYRQTEAAA